LEMQGMNCLLFSGILTVPEACLSGRQGRYKNSPAMRGMKPRDQKHNHFTTLQARPNGTGGG
jgi:hypothetical protein